jgi:RNA polymerase sigma-70 factor (ECF subfamily)
VTLWSRSQQPCEDAGTDVILLERIAAHDATAVGELYDRHGRLLYGLILRILGHRGEAEEVLQEVFLNVWTHAGSYNVSLGSPAGWLVRITRNRAIDRLRANAVRLRAAESMPQETFQAETPETHATFGEQRREVARALQALPADQRELIEQAYYLGLTHTELAARHRLPLGTVKTRIRTGMLALRQQLSRWNYT